MRVDGSVVSGAAELLRPPKGSLLEEFWLVTMVPASEASDASLILFLSLNAVTCTGATVEETVALVSGGMGLVEDEDFDVAGVEIDAALEDFCDCDWPSDVPVKDEAVGDCMRDDGLESWTGEFDAPLTSLVRLEDEALKDGVPGLELFVETEMLLEASSLLGIVKALSLPPPTTPRNRL